MYSVHLRELCEHSDRRRQRGEARPEVGSDVAAGGSMIEAIWARMHGERTETFGHAGSGRAATPVLSSEGTAAVIKLANGEHSRISWVEASRWCDATLRVVSSVASAFAR